MSRNETKKIRINAATALNSRYMRYAYVMLTSLFYSHAQAEKETEFHVYLLHSDLTETDQAYLNSLAEEYGHVIHFLKIDRASLPQQLPATQDWPLEMYFRLMLPDILPGDVDRLLYLDVDMIIQKPIIELYQTDMEGSYFCVCPDMTVTFPVSDIRDEIFKEHIANEEQFTYFNSGLMLWDIDALRGRYCFRDYMELAERLEYKMLAPDQDLLNYLHWDQVKYLDAYRYDLFSKKAYRLGYRYDRVKRETTVVHFAGMKPWEGKYVHYDIEQLWWDYAKMTPFYPELMEEFMRDCIKDPLVYDTIDSLSEEKKRLMEELNKSVSLCRQLARLLEQK